MPRKTILLVEPNKETALLYLETLRQRHGRDATIYHVTSAAIALAELPNMNSKPNVIVYAATEQDYSDGVVLLKRSGKKKEGSP